MRIAVTGIAALLLVSAPAFANEICTENGQLVTYAPVDKDGGGLVTVNRGQQFAVSCDDIRAEGADVRVVMSLANPTEVSPGFTSVMATNQNVFGHAVNVQVPDVPDLANHTVRVKVYVTDANGTTACDAGNIRVV